MGLIACERSGFFLIAMEDAEVLENPHTEKLKQLLDM
jgi:hypothetical protein